VANFHEGGQDACPLWGTSTKNDLELQHEGGDRREIHATHIKTSLDTAAINVMQTKKTRTARKPCANKASSQPPVQEVMCKIE